MKEEYLAPELNIVCFTSMQHLAVSVGGGEGDGISSEKDEDFGMDIL